jgi:hypothetical protein
VAAFAGPSACALDTRTFVVEQNRLLVEAGPGSGGGGFGSGGSALEGGPGGSSSGGSPADGGGGYSTGGQDTGGYGPGGGGSSSGGAGGAPACDDGVGVDGGTTLRNTDFNCDTWGWQSDLQASIAWNSKDSGGSSSSGSISVTNNEVDHLDGYQAYGAWQCVAVSGSGLYQVTAQGFRPDTRDSAYMEINFYFYNEPNCQGALGAYDQSQVKNDVTGQWVTLSHATNAAGYKSMAVRLSVDKPYKTEPVQAFFDAVQVKQL